MGECGAKMVLLNQPGHAVSLLRKCHFRMFFLVRRGQNQLLNGSSASGSQNRIKTVICMDVRESKHDQILIFCIVASGVTFNIGGGRDVARKVPFLSIFLVRRGQNQLFPMFLWM